MRNGKETSHLIWIWWRIFSSLQVISSCTQGMANIPLPWHCATILHMAAIITVAQNLNLSSQDIASMSFSILPRVLLQTACVSRAGTSIKPAHHRWTLRSLQSLVDLAYNYSLRIPIKKRENNILEIKCILVFSHRFQSTEKLNQGIPKKIWLFAITNQLFSILPTCKNLRPTPPHPALPPPRDLFSSTHSWDSPGLGWGLDTGIL